MLRGEDPAAFLLSLKVRFPKMFASAFFRSSIYLSVSADYYNPLEAFSLLGHLQVRLLIFRIGLKD